MVKICLVEKGLQKSHFWVGRKQISIWFHGRIVTGNHRTVNWYQRSLRAGRAWRECLPAVSEVRERKTGRIDSSTWRGNRIWRSPKLLLILSRHVVLMASLLLSSQMTKYVNKYVVTFCTREMSDALMFWVMGRPTDDRLESYCGVSSVKKLTTRS